MVDICRENQRRLSPIPIVSGKRQA